jgi:light-regulated signal transduction histidine kinase (bacteriophytochrome)
VNGDINTIRQVWINLVSNAIKYSGNRKEQRIEIGSSRNGRQHVFYVKDNGVGFDEAYRHKLFKVFQRLHSAEEFAGTGVGLALVEKIISKHGGKVWAEGKEGEGACFYFSLPA